MLPLTTHTNAYYANIHICPKNKKLIMNRDYAQKCLYLNRMYRINLKYLHTYKEQTPTYRPMNNIFKFPYIRPLSMHGHNIFSKHKNHDWMYTLKKPNRYLKNPIYYVIAQNTICHPKNYTCIKI